MCAVALAVQASGMHLHVGLHDGHASQAVHILSFADQHEQQHARESQDFADADHAVLNPRHGVEIDLDTHAVSKSFDTRGDDGALVYAFIAFLVLVPRRISRTVIARVVPTFGRPLYFLRPPLRGPPLSILL